MKATYEKIWNLAKPFLNSRKNDIHTEISVQLAFKLLRKEGGEEDIVIPAVILHDIGWSQVPESLQLKAFGPKAVDPQLNRIHELEGAKLAGKILERIGYDQDKIDQIIEIINGHDSRKEAISANDRIVKDADKLWRYTNSGFYIDMDRFEESFDEGLDRLRVNLSKWFFTSSAKEIALKEVKKREKEWIL